MNRVKKACGTGWRPHSFWEFLAAFILGIRVVLLTISSLVKGVHNEVMSGLKTNLERG